MGTPITFSQLPTNAGGDTASLMVVGFDASKPAGQQDRLYPASLFGTLDFPDGEFLSPEGSLADTYFAPSGGASDAYITVSDAPSGADVARGLATQDLGQSVVNQQPLALLQAQVAALVALLTGPDGTTANTLDPSSLQITGGTLALTTVPKPVDESSISDTTGVLSVIQTPFSASSDAGSLQTGDKLLIVRGTSVLSTTWATIKLDIGQ